jgi:hypothetical protein
MAQNANGIIIARNNYYILEVNQYKNRAYLTLLGLWQNQSELSDYLNDIKEALKKMSSDFTLLADLSHYNGTAYELHHLHIEALKLAMKAGLSRIAEVFSANPVVKMFSETYSKESGANTMAFKSFEHAERWLDLY